jgi:hypothetical protein
MEQDQLSERFHAAFAKMKEELQFNASFEELDDVFFLEDYILQCRYVSKSISRMVCARIRDTFSSWINYLHSLLLPNPSSMINHAEHQLFNDADRQKITETLHHYLALTSKNALIGLNKDKAAEAAYIDNAVKVWKDNLSFLINISEKVNNHWKKAPIHPKQ